MWCNAPVWHYWIESQYIFEYIFLFMLPFFITMSHAFTSMSKDNWVPKMHSRCTVVRSIDLHTLRWVNLYRTKKNQHRFQPIRIFGILRMGIIASFRILVVFLPPSIDFCNIMKLRMSQKVRQNEFKVQSFSLSMQRFDIFLMWMMKHMPFFLSRLKIRVHLFDSCFEMIRECVFCRCSFFYIELCGTAWMNEWHSQNSTRRSDTDKSNAKVKNDVIKLKNGIIAPVNMSGGTIENRIPHVVWATGCIFNWKTIHCPDIDTHTRCGHLFIEFTKHLSFLQLVLFSLPIKPCPCNSVDTSMCACARLTTHSIPYFSAFRFSDIENICCFALFNSKSHCGTLRMWVPKNIQERNLLSMLTLTPTTTAAATPEKQRKTKCVKLASKFRRKQGRRKRRRN